jgi:hypothetical protein
MQFALLSIFDMTVLRMVGIRPPFFRRLPLFFFFFFRRLFIIEPAYGADGRRTLRRPVSATGNGSLSVAGFCSVGLSAVFFFDIRGRCDVSFALNLLFVASCAIFEWSMGMI